MIWQVVTPSGPLVVGRTLRRLCLCRRGALKTEGSKILSRPHRSQYLRPFGTSHLVTKNTDSRFFWPSRPDFLPTNSGKAKEVSDSRQNLEIKNSTQSIKRYLPLYGARVPLPAPESIHNSHAPLYTSLAKMEVEPAWSRFTLHLRDLANGDTIPIDSLLFDNLFWLLATENFSLKERHEEVFARLEILLLYASSQADFGVTRLQLHRLVYIWTTLWEQHEKKRLPFGRIGFLEKVMSHLNDLHSLLTNRIFSCMLTACTTAEEIGLISTNIQSWLGGKCRETQSRQEIWTLSSKVGDVDDNIYFDTSQGRYLDQGTCQHLLDKCVKIGRSEEAKAAGVLALNQPNMDTSLHLIPWFLAFFDSSQLFGLLPTEVKQGATTLAKDVPIQTIGRKPPLFSQQNIDRLVYPIAFVLATRLHYSAALYLFETRKKSSKDDIIEAQQVQTFAEIVKACARLAISESIKPLHDSTWQLLQFQRGIRVFAGSEWDKSKSKQSTCNVLISAFRLVIVHDAERAAAQSKEQWLLLLRQFTTVLLSKDPRLDILNLEQDSKDFYRLLEVHIHLEDFAFAKRLLLIQFNQESRKKTSNLLMSRRHFLWMFLKSIDLDSDVRFTNQLFLHWCSIGNSEGEESYLDAIPSSLLRMYFWKLKASDNETRGIKMLQQNLQDTLDKVFPARHQSIRMMRTGFEPGIEYIDVSLHLAGFLIQHWKTERSDVNSTLIELYSIAMDRSTTRIQESDRSIRLQIIAIFRDFQKHFQTRPRETRLNLVKTKERAILTIYGRAIKTLIPEAKSKSTLSEIEAIFSELQKKWKIQPNPNIWSRRIESYLEGDDKDVNRALELYNEALELFGNDKQAEQVLPTSTIEQQRQEFTETDEKVLTAAVTSKLVMALGQRGNYDDALQVLSLYQLHATPMETSSQIIIEGAQAAILYMRGNTHEALKMLEIIEQRERFGSTAKWLRLVQKTTRQLEQKLNMQGEVHEQQQQDDILPPAELNEEEKERARVYAAMASGVPWKRK